MVARFELLSFKMGSRFRDLGFVLWGWGVPQALSILQHRLRFGTFNTWATNTAPSIYGTHKGTTTHMDTD